MPSPPRPPGISILTASAPQSTSWRTHVGPARARVRSSTLNRASGREPLLVMALDDTSQQGDEKRPSPSLARCSLPATWQGHASVGNASPPRIWAFLSACVVFNAPLKVRVGLVHRGATVLAAVLPESEEDGED